MKAIIDFIVRLIQGRRESGSARSAEPVEKNTAIPSPALPVFYLTKREIEVIRTNREDYAFATKTAGPWPWIVLPPIHKRETDLALRGPASGGGPFQLDPPGAGQQLGEIRAYVLATYEKYGYVGDPDLDRDFRGACLVAAHEFRERMGKGISIIKNGQIDEEALKYAYWGYNGRSRYHTAWALDPIRGKPDEPKKFVNRKAEYSGYVMNDPARGFCLWCHGTLPPKNPGEPDHELTWRDKRPGVFVLYRELIERMEEICD